MANEWTKVELYGANNDGEPRRYTIATGTSISKGALLTLTDPRTATAQSTNGYTAGVASEEHISGGGTSIAAWTNGVFSVTASGGIRAGETIVGCNGNTVASGAALSASSGARAIGYALENAAHAETLTVRLRL